MRYLLIALLAMGLLVSGVAYQARAWDEKKADTTKGDEGDEKPTKTTAAERGAMLLNTAYQMASTGREMKDPIMLLAAARAMASVKVVPLDEKRVEKGPEAAKGESVGKELQKEAEALVDEAEKLAKDKDAFKKLAAATREKISEGVKGAVGGPQTRRGELKGRDRQDSFTIRFNGGAHARIYINNVRKRGDINLAIFDSSGKLVASDRRLDDDARATFWVRRTQSYRIVIKQAGGRGELNYRLTTN
jgi:hypothetical protein